MRLSVAVCIAAFATDAVARATQSRLAKREFRPENKSVRVLANVTDPSVSRDSCGSVRIGSRVFWTCRDTSIGIGDGKFVGTWANTVGWTDYNLDGSPAIQSGGAIGAGSNGTNNILLMKGPPPATPLFYPLDIDMCPDNGNCGDGTRWVGWPDSPPMVTNTAVDGTVTAYTWIYKDHLRDLEQLIPERAATLFKLQYKPNFDYNVVPEVTVIDWAFWREGEIGFGVSGNVVRNGVAYLYCTLPSKQMALAKVPVDCVEDRTKYQYFVNGTWTAQMPSLNDAGAAIPNASAGGQGTYYFSERHQSYIWIGQANFSVNTVFYITTAPNPEGPWLEPYLLYKGADGDSDLPGYSLQAHPHMLRLEDDGIYLTWTMQFKEETYGAYVTPLAYLSFV